MNAQKMWHMNTSSKTGQCCSQVPFTCPAHCGWTKDNMFEWLKMKGTKLLWACLTKTSISPEIIGKQHSIGKRTKVFHDTAEFTSELDYSLASCLRLMNLIFFINTIFPEN